MNNDATKFFTCSHSNKLIKLYTYKTGLWTSKHPVSTSPAMTWFSISNDWSTLVYVDVSCNVYVSKYDATTDLYINPTKITLTYGIDSNHRITLSPDGKMFALHYRYVYYYRWDEGMQTYYFAYRYNVGYDIFDVYISPDNCRSIAVFLYVTVYTPPWVFRINVF
jgi:hypothetical protein